jgi:type IV pilus assembly protein PilX
MRNFRPTTGSLRTRQSGLVLFVALIVLVAMSLAGIAIMRSVGSGAMVSANLAFKQTTTVGAERGIEAAKTWLLSQSNATLNNDVVTSGYYSSWGVFDPTTYDWSSGTVTLPADSAGTAIFYIVHRLCQTPNATINATGQQCVMKSVTTSSSSAGGSSGGVGYGAVNLKTTVSPYYRVTVRSVGPKNAVSYVQVIYD